MTMPTFSAGQRVTGAQLQSLSTGITNLINTVFPVVYLETAVDAAVINTTTLADDGYLIFNNLVSGGKYLVVPKIHMRSAAATDLKVGWSCSGTSATFLWSPKGLPSSAATTNNAEDHSQLLLSDTYTYGTISAVATSQAVEPIGRLYAGTGGSISFKFRWAQGALDAVNGTTIMAGSSCTLIRTA